MENMDKKVCTGCMCGGSCAGGSCGCMQGMGMWGGGRHHHLLRMILKLILVALIFTIGFKLGVMTGFIRAGYGYGYGMNGAGNNWGMMRGYPTNLPVTPQNMMSPIVPLR